MKRASARLGWTTVVLAGLVMGLAGCQGAGKKGDAGTSTGLPYRPPGTPTYTDLPSGFRTFPAAQPLGK